MSEREREREREGEGERERERERERDVSNRELVEYSNKQTNQNNVIESHSKQTE